MRIVPNRLKDLRKQCRLTQDELGAYANIQKSGVAKYENGRIGSAPDETIAAFAEALNTTVDYLSGKLESDLLALDIVVTQEGTLVYVDDQTNGTHATFHESVWRTLSEDSAEGFRKVWSELTGLGKPTPGDESGLTPTQLAAWELVCKLDEASLDKFISAAKLFLG